MEVVLDDPKAVAFAGLCLPLSLAQRLGLGELIETNVDLRDAPGHANVGDWSFGAMAHNLARWTARLGECSERIMTTPKLRQHFIAIPGHITHSGRRTTLHLAQGLPWAEAFMTALAEIRGLRVLNST